MNFVHMFVWTLAATVLCGCASRPQVGFQQAPEQDIASFKTYRLQPLPDALAGVDPGFVLRNRAAIKTSLRAALAAQGYEESDAGDAELEVRLRTDVRQSRDGGSGFSIGLGAGSYGGSGGGSVGVSKQLGKSNTREEVRLRIELNATDSGELIWVGWSPFQKDTALETTLGETITAILQQLPPTGPTTGWHIAPADTDTQASLLTRRRNAQLFRRG